MLKLGFIFFFFQKGPAWPSAAKILQQWLPPSQFATWYNFLSFEYFKTHQMHILFYGNRWSVISTGSNLAGALGPLLATSIAVQYHW